MFFIAPIKKRWMLQQLVTRCQVSSLQEALMLYSVEAKGLVKNSHSKQVNTWFISVIFNNRTIINKTWCLSAEVVAIIKAIKAFANHPMVLENIKKRLLIFNFPPCSQVTNWSLFRELFFYFCNIFYHPKKKKKKKSKGTPDLLIAVFIFHRPHSTNGPNSSAHDHP